MRPLISIFFSLFLCGCGTLLTRTKGDPVGAYPFTATVLDAAVVAQSIKEPVLIVFVPICLISFPIDLAVDVILLPIDWEMWPYGFKKEISLPKI